jgi:N utilization substance protein A
MNRELILLMEQIGREKGIEQEILAEAIKAAIVSASRKRLGHLDNIEADIDMESGQISLAIIKDVVEEVETPEAECTLEEARTVDPEAALEDKVAFHVEVDISELGRIAAQTAKQVIVQRVREAEREMVYNEYKDRQGDIIMGIVQRYEKGNYIIDLGKAEAILPYREQSFREQFHRGDRLRAYVLEVRSTTRGPQIVLSRTHPGLLIKLFEMEVPEVYEGIVEIREAVREPSGRAKIAVVSKDRDVDPVGACVGVRGSRVQAIVQELRGEKIDIIEWSDDHVKFVNNALSPAKISKIIPHEDENKMEVIVPEDQLSLAIGKKGQNVRLAAKLTHWKIDIKSEDDFKKEQDEIALAAAEALLGPRKRPEEPTLEDLPGVGSKTAESLREAGFTTVGDVAAASMEELLALGGLGAKKAEAIRIAAIELMEELASHIEATPAEVAESPEEEPVPSGEVEEETEAVPEAQEEALEPVGESVASDGGDGSHQSSPVDVETDRDEDGEGSAVEEAPKEE